MENKYPFFTAGLSSEEIENFLETYNTLQKEFNATFIEPSVFDFKEWFIEKDYHESEIWETIQLKPSDANCLLHYVSIRNIYTGIKGGSHSVSEFRCWGTSLLRRDFGHVLIKHETFSDKLKELITPLELDFPEDKTFSKKFYVLAKDRTKAELAINSSFRTLLLDLKLKDILIEIKGHKLVIASKTLLNSETALKLAVFIDKVSNI